MHLQAWDPYFFAHFGVENEAKELFNGWGPDFFSPLLASFVIFCFKYSFHSHRVNLAGQTFAGFFAVSLYPLFIYFAENFVSQFNFVALFVELILVCLSEI